MSITKPFTFVAGTKARANEVNQNFDVLYSQVNSNISAINTNANDIDTLDSNKANVNGSSSQRFACADPTSPSDAVNKQSLTKAIGNSINYIDGYVISKDSGSPNDTIIVTAGSCYDYMRSVVLTKDTSTTKQNSSQGASTTYYVYVIGNDNGSSVDILISSNAVTPTLPSGYILFRQIGYYTTDTSNNINNINYYGIDVSSNKSPDVYINSMMPDYSKIVSISSGYTVAKFGYIFAYAHVRLGTSSISINNVSFNIASSSKEETAAGSGNLFPVSPGDYVTANWGGREYGLFQFIPCKGVM